MTVRICHIWQSCGVHVHVGIDFLFVYCTCPRVFTNEGKGFKRIQFLNRMIK